MTVATRSEAIRKFQMKGGFPARAKGGRAPDVDYVGLHSNGGLYVYYKGLDTPPVEANLTLQTVEYYLTQGVWEEI